LPTFPAPLKFSAAAVLKPLKFSGAAVFKPLKFSGAAVFKPLKFSGAIPQSLNPLIPMRRLDPLVDGVV
jgi:hypothetical protein